MLARLYDKFFIKFLYGGKANDSQKENFYGW